MERRELSDDVIEATESSPSETVELLEKFRVSECWEKPFRQEDLQDTVPMMNYVNRLKQEGLDIGKGDAEFGYKMPLPKRDANSRYLQIFRRR
ncbi:hypothetical protein HN604_03920 [archaeon]|jgi:hypothetical protein|nr:hypothetical protein [archaeon]MBT6182596.1 hypothetical protein [archaeon]MBT6606274.1 hypothetical protein [archaeon]MBT7251557.1 hypothetical protein [archaeon]MBT7661197.1 hypothetical protein [archaeon]